MATQIEFGVGLKEVFKVGFTGYLKNIIPLSVAGAITLAVYGIFRYEAQQFLNDGGDFRALVVDLVGLVLSGTIAYPWFHYALTASRGEKVDIRDPFFFLPRFGHQAVASFFFWAAFLFGLRYGKGIFFLPAIAVGVLYAFYGFVVADTPLNKEGLRGGTYALGTSVRLGEKRRFGLFAIGCLFLMFNFVGAMFGLAIKEQTLLQYAVTIIGLIITTSITLVGGAHIYDTLKEKLP